MRLHAPLLIALGLILAVAPATATTTLYNNIPPGCATCGFFNTNAWAINFGYAVSDSFVLAPGAHGIEDLHFVYWVASATDLLTTVDVAAGATSFGGSIQTLSGVTNTFMGINSHGYFVYRADYAFPDIPWSGAGYLTLQNACATSGCSVSTEVYWDQNSGPSFAYENTGGGGTSCALTSCMLNPIGSETFWLTGL